jgi:hypothetical protein
MACLRYPEISSIALWLRGVRLEFSCRHLLWAHSASGFKSGVFTSKRQYQLGKGGRESCQRGNDAKKLPRGSGATIVNFGLFCCRWRHRGPKPTKTLHREVVRPMQELESESGLDQMNSEISRVLIRPLTTDDLPEARRIFCAAFGTFLGASDPKNFWADRDYVNGRFGAEHVASFAAELDGELVGSNFAIR